MNDSDQTEDKHNHPITKPIVLREWTEIFVSDNARKTMQNWTNLEQKFDKKEKFIILDGDKEFKAREKMDANAITTKSILPVKYLDSSWDDYRSVTVVYEKNQTQSQNGNSWRRQNLLEGTILQTARRASPPNIIGQLTVIKVGGKFNLIADF